MKKHWLWLISIVLIVVLAACTANEDAGKETDEGSSNDDETAEETDDGESGEKIFASIMGRSLLLWIHPLALTKFHGIH